jgi:hypothetical protein
MRVGKEYSSLGPETVPVGLFTQPKSSCDGCQSRTKTNFSPNAGFFSGSLKFRV